MGIKQRRFNWRAATRRGDEKRGGAGSRTKGLEYGEGKEREEESLGSNRRDLGFRRKSPIISF